MNRKEHLGCFFVGFPQWVVRWGFGGMIGEDGGKNARIHVACLFDLEAFNQIEIHDVFLVRF